MKRTAPNAAFGLLPVKWDCGGVRCRQGETLWGASDQRFVVANPRVGLPRARTEDPGAFWETCLLRTRDNRKGLETKQQMSL